MKKLCSVCGDKIKGSARVHYKLCHEAHFDNIVRMEAEAERFLQGLKLVYPEVERK